MGFSPVILYHLGRTDADLIVSKCIHNFDWIVTFFYGDKLNDVPVSIDKIKKDIPTLAKSSEGKILFLDFLPVNDDFRAYLYSTWRGHCPSQISNELLTLMQRCYELGITDQKRIMLERLFYQSIFGDKEDFQPCMVIINVRYQYMIKRNFTRKDLDKELLGAVLNGISLIKANKQDFFDNASMTAKFLLPRFGELSTSSTCNPALAIADFLDTVEDAALCFENQELRCESSLIDGEILESTKKFKSAFQNLEDDIKKQGSKVIKNLLAGTETRYKKIKLSDQFSLYRIKVNDKYRIHFKGTPTKPIFINIGSHKLCDFGYKID